MAHVLKLKVSGRSRGNNSRLRAIVVVSANAEATASEMKIAAEVLKTMKPDRYGVLLIPSSSQFNVKVYPIK